MSVREAIATFEIRHRSTLRAGSDVDGIVALLDVLRERSQTEAVLLFHFNAGDRFFSVFISEDAGTIVGCISGEMRPSAATAT